ATLAITASTAASAGTAGTPSRAPAAARPRRPADDRLLQVPRPRRQVAFWYRHLAPPRRRAAREVDARDHAPRPLPAGLPRCRGKPTHRLARPGTVRGRMPGRAHRPRRQARRSEERRVGKEG